jgi:hypothetical protein
MERNAKLQVRPLTVSLWADVYSVEAASHLAIQKLDEDSFFYYYYYCRRLWSDAVKNEPHHIPLAAVSVSVTKEVRRPPALSLITLFNRHLTVIVLFGARATQVTIQVEL